MGEFAGRLFLKVMASGESNDIVVSETEVSFEKGQLLATIETHIGCGSDNAERSFEIFVHALIDIEEVVVVVEMCHDIHIITPTMELIWFGISLDHSVTHRMNLRDIMVEE